MADLSGRLRLPCVGLRATRPPQTPGDPGAVKPDTCPCTCTHAYPPLHVQSPPPGTTVIPHPGGRTVNK